MYVFGCLSFELAMMKVMPYDRSHEEVYNANVYHENLNRTENRGFFLQNLPKPTDRKYFETVTTLADVVCYRYCAS